jgi:catechol 2,3-dioxygenase-like lactoylglutathione lyase family enzyme
MVLTQSDLVAFIPTTDVERARGFYVDDLGLQLVESNPYACVLSSGGVTVRVTPVAELHAQPFTVLGWHVDDIRTSITELATRSVEFLHYDGMQQDDLGVWTAPSGAQIAWFADPDRNVLSLTQL